MKVICIDAGNYGNPGFGGPIPKEGDILTVGRAYEYEGIPSYEFVEYGPNYLYSQRRFAPLSQIDETEMERNYNKELA